MLGVSFQQRCYCSSDRSGLLCASGKGRLNQWAAAAV